MPPVAGPDEARRTPPAQANHFRCARLVPRARHLSYGPTRVIASVRGLEELLFDVGRRFVTDLGPVGAEELLAGLPAALEQMHEEIPVGIDLAGDAEMA